MVFTSFCCTYYLISASGCHRISLKRRKWAVNSAITQNERLDVYFVDPSEGNRTIIEKINEGTYLLLYGPRASGKSTCILCLQEQLEENGYACI